MIIFLYGEDTFRSRQKLKEIKEKFNREVDQSGGSLNILDGEKANLRVVNEAVSPMSLLSRKRMTVIGGVFKNKSQAVFGEILELLKKREKDEGSIIVFLEEISGLEKLPKYKSELFRFLAGQKFASEFKILSNTEATNWAKAEVAKRGGHITHQGAAMLASLVGSDLWQINNEIDKLINFKLGQGLALPDGMRDPAITPQDVKDMVHGKFDENIFALTDAVGAKNKSEALRLFEEQLDAGVAGAYLLAMITRQFKIILQVKSALEQGKTPRQISSVLKLHPFAAQKAAAQAANFSEELLKKILNFLIEADFKMKTGQGDPKVMISSMIAKI